MRRIGFAVAAFAALLAACGKQVTPDLPGVGPGGLSGGYTSVRFDVAGTMDFANYQYIVAFNTTGTTVTPGTNTPASYDGYSYAVVVGGNAGGTYASIWEYARTPGLSGNSQPTLYQVGTTPAQVQYAANSNGDYTEFTVSFARIVFKCIKPTGSARLRRRSQARGDSTRSPASATHLERGCYRFARRRRRQFRGSAVDFAGAERRPTFRSNVLRAR